MNFSSGAPEYNPGEAGYHLNESDSNGGEVSTGHQDPQHFLVGTRSSQIGTFTSGAPPSFGAVPAPPEAKTQPPRVGAAGAGGPAAAALPETVSREPMLSAPGAHTTPPSSAGFAQSMPQPFLGEAAYPAAAPPRPTAALTSANTADPAHFTRDPSDVTVQYSSDDEAASTGKPQESTAFAEQSKATHDGDDGRAPLLDVSGPPNKSTSRSPTNPLGHLLPQLPRDSAATATSPRRTARYANADNLFMRIDEAKGSEDEDERLHGSDSSSTEGLARGIRVVVTRDKKRSEVIMNPREVARLYAEQQAALQSLQSRFDFLRVPDWVRLHPQLGPYLAEAFGTFAWVLTLCLTSVRNQSIFTISDDTNMTSVPIGFMLTSMVFTFAYISGGHFNPAVTLAVFLIRRMSLSSCVIYIIVEVLAAIGAGLVGMAIQGNTDIFVPSVTNSYISSGIFSESIFTFAVVLVVLNIAYSRQSGSFFYGFAVGMTVAAGSASVGRISGGAFNPAAATGLQMAVCLTGNCAALKNFWIYWLSPIVGALLASLLFSQMYQPINTQVLQDHKVFSNPAKNSLHNPRNVSVDREGEADQQQQQTYSGSTSSRSSRNGEDGRRADDSKLHVAQEGHEEEVVAGRAARTGEAPQREEVEVKAFE